MSVSIMNSGICSGSSSFSPTCAWPVPSSESMPEMSMLCLVMESG